MIQVQYLENVLVPHQFRQLSCEPSSLAALAPDWQGPFICLLDGEPVLRGDWTQEVAPGATVLFIDVNAIPQGGGGGSNPLRTVLMLAVMVAAPALAGSLTAGAGIFGGMSPLLVKMGLQIGGMALINAFIPTPKPATPASASAIAAASPTYNIQAQGNLARLEGAIPEHFGRVRAFPDFAAMPYAEYSGNEQFVYSLLCVGRGAYDIETLQIEDTPISSFEEVTYEVVQPSGSVTLFPANVVTSAEVTGQTTTTGVFIGPFVVNASATTINYIGVDFVAPRGLYYANDNGTLASQSVVVQTDAVLINDSGAIIGVWTTLGTKTYSGATTTPQRYSERYTVAVGRYMVRVKRTDTEQTGTRYGHNLTWSGLRGYMKNTSSYGDVTLLALRMRASNSLSLQSSRKVNVIATRKLPIWNGSSWSANTATQSIAWPLAYAAKQVGLTDSQIDLAALLTLSSTWSSRGDTFNGRFDSFMSFWEAISLMAAAGRTKCFMQGGVMRYVRDQSVAVPVALFSVRNIIKDSFEVDYLMPTEETADAVNVSYFDGIAWANQVVKAKLPGSSAAKPAKMTLFGVTSRDQAYREGMYHAADNTYRRKRIRFATEMEGFIPSFGDLIAIQHDMPAWGQGGEATAWNGATRNLTLSEAPTWGTGTHYIGLRKRDGSLDGPFVVTLGASANIVVLATSPSFTPYTGTDEERTHYAFGWAETWRQTARVLAVTPKSLYQIEILAINESANVHSADNGVVTPVAPTSQLAGYTNMPVVTGVTVTPMLYQPNVLVVAWQAAPWADHYIVQQSVDGVTWTEAGSTGLTTLTLTSLYGATTLIRVAAVGIARGPWASTVTVSVDKTPPPLAPTGTATGAMFSVVLTWSFGDALKERQGTEVWWASTNNRALAVRLSVEPYPGTSYIHYGLQAGTGGYYWIRVADNFGNFSSYYPASPTAGLYAVASTDSAQILAQLNNAIDVAQLTANLNTRLDLIDGPGVGTIATDVNLVQARLDTGDYAAVKVESTANTASVGTLNARHTVHLEANGYISGTESVNSGTSSSFTVLADKFLVAKPDGSDTPIPMMSMTTINGMVNLGINGNIIADGSIIGRSLVASTVTADKIDSRGLSIKDGAGNVILAAGTALTAANILPDAGWLNANVTLGGLGYTGALNATYTTNTNQLTDGAALGQTATWSGVTGTGKPQDYATYTTNTSQLTDGAALGQTATWSGVSGAGKPQDNANYTTNTNQLTDGAALGQTAAWSGVSGAGKPQDYATYGATFGSNISGQITSGNISTYIQSAAITNAYIGNAAVGTLTIAGRAVTVPGVANGPAQSWATGEGQKVMCQLGLTTSGEQVFISWSINTAFGVPGWLTVLYRDGIVLVNYSKLGLNGCFLDFPAAGGHTYTLMGTYTAAGAQSILGSTLFCMEVKR